MGLTPNRQLFLELLGYLPLLVLGLVAVDALHWIWLWKKGRLTPLQRRQRYRRYMLLFTAGIGLLAASQFTRDLLADRVWWHTAAYPAMFLVSLLVVLFHPVYREPTKQDVERHYGRNPRYCGRCDYDLTGNTSGICPECGWVIPAAPMRVEDPDWWRWWRKWNIGYLERWRRTLVVHLLIVPWSFAAAAITLFVYTSLKPIVIIDPLTGLASLHRPWFVHFLLVAALVAVLAGLHAGLNAVRITLYGLRKGRESSTPGLGRG